MFAFPLLLTIYAGFAHAFEADHLLAVSSIVSQRSNTLSSLKDGLLWGLGHASTILLIGILMMICRVGISAHCFHYFEATVGFMLIGLAIYRLVKFFHKKKITIHRHAHDHAGAQHKHLHVHIGSEHIHRHSHSLAYGVGLVHGLAGSGALVIAAMSEISSTAAGIAYLLIFGGGCIMGMMVASGLFSIPFSRKIMEGQMLQSGLVVISCLLCLIYGGKVIFENIML